ncbi:AMP-binding protein, partial [Methylocucumis oryzae]|uniref:AMP-binding protein n=1 Tax=Methylocucumis oryzae TaxID=1632867 RepID=UPI00178C8A05
MSVLYPPTSHAYHLVDTLARLNQPINLSVVCVGGEAVAADRLASLKQWLNPARLINGYGPTETVITPLAWVCPGARLTELKLGLAYAPIGTALGPRALYVLDADLNPVPPGVVGELFIAGPCLARGYHARPGLTAACFVPDPFAQDGGRMYRTGDLVRRLPEGEFVYLARRDQQIKLRGYRIEPGEIEAALRQLPGVADACVVLRDDAGQRYLCAYWVRQASVAADADSLHPAAFKAALAQQLPEAMIPSQYVLLAQLPRTAHGKLDRAALPAPDFAATRSRQAACNAIEQQLLALWHALLGHAEFGVTDNFFELGGDSIVAIQLVSRARAQGLLFSAKQLFQYQTVRALAQVTTCQNATIEHEQAPAQGNAPLLPIQHEFFQQALSKIQHWNQSLTLTPTSILEPNRLGEAWQRVMALHDSVRLRYRHTADG